MRPEIIIENTLRPDQFVTATTAGVAGAVATKGDKTLLIIVLALLALGLGYVAWRSYQDGKKDGYEGLHVY